MIWDVDVDEERGTAKGELGIRVELTAVDRATGHMPLDKGWKVDSRCQSVNSILGIQWGECPFNAVLKFGFGTTRQWLF